MALEEFEKEQISDREKNAIRMRRITTKYTAQYINQYDPLVIKLFAGLCWVYGLFRLYRGYKKNYYSN